VAITQWILGLRPDYDGLRIEPVLPAGWAGFTARRTYRGVQYEIEVHRRGAGNAVQLRVDGQAVSGTLVPLPDKAVTRVKVDVTIG
jgi:cellobiose phosphorylase